MIETKPNEMTENFLNFVKEKCKDQKVKLNLSSLDHVVTGKVKCNGYFDDEDMELAVASGKEFRFWFKTLVHEYAHMTQWMDDADVWIKLKFKPVDAETMIDLWLDHEVELNEKQLQMWLSTARNVEADCEKRALKLVEKFSLPIDLGYYAQQGNAYAYFWTYMKHSRKWYTIGREPYNIPEIVSAMPYTMEGINHDILPDTYKQLFDTYLSEPVTNKA